MSTFQRLRTSIRKKIKSISRLELIVITVILIGGAFLRLYNIRGYMTFLGDEGRDVLIVRRMLVDFDITFVGPTASVGGFFLGPIYYYFMAPFLALFRLDPVGPAVMVALFGIATIFLLYRFGKELYSPFVGIIASLMYAISPLVIAQSRSSWNPNIVPFFSLLYIYALYKAAVVQKKIWFFIAGACVGIGIQLHYLFLFLIPVGVVFFLLYLKPLKKFLVHYGFVLMGFLFFMLPFLGFEIKNGLPNMRTILKYLETGEDITYSQNGFQIIHNVLFRMFSRLVFYFPPPEQIEISTKTIYGPWSIAIYLTLISSVTLLVYRIYKKRTKQDVLLFVWLLFGVGLFSLYQRSIYDYYLVIVFTVPFLLLAQMLHHLMQKKFLVPIVAVVIVWLVWLNLTGVPFRNEPNSQLEQVKSISLTAFNAAEGKPFNFALITSSNSDHAYRYFFEMWGLPPVTIQNPDVDPERKTVTDQLIVICEIPYCQPLGHPLWEIAGFGQAEIVGSWEHPPVMIYKLVHYEGEVIQ
ncbi:MAG: glycosyltransferase family 39 protein [Candidatus Roizmanbacteria bacterium]|nr:glycosyltransferase family 39 protein [Candidatus Roizmanbacteria bacterium]